MGPPAREAADTQFRPLNVGQNADGPVEFLLHLADHGETPRVILMRAVGEIQPEHVRAGLEQSRQDFWRGARRSERGDDLRTPATA